MTDEIASTSNGFRSLVERIQENDAEVGGRGRPARRRLTIPNSARSKPVEPAPTPPSGGGAPTRLLQRRWL